MDPNDNSSPYWPYFSLEIFEDNFSGAVNLNDDAYEAAPPAPTPSTKGKKVKYPAHKTSGSRGGGGGLHRGRDRSLGSVLVDISQDSVVGNAQTKGSYWSTILEAYEANQPEGTPTRNSQKLCTQCDRFKSLLEEFQQLYKECEMASRSGKREVDMLTRALYEWQTMKGAPFTHLETWRIVNDTPKFTTIFSAKFKIEETANRTKTREDGAYTTSVSESAPSMGAPASIPYTSSRAKRLTGRDAGKE